MNPIERGIRAIDRWQQRRSLTAFPFAVFKKFGDDSAGNLVALLTYFAFLATFPLLLALSAILAIVLKGHPELQAKIQTSAFAEFPIVGTQLRSQLGVASLGHTGLSLIVGILGAVLGGRGLANATQNALNSVWNVPKVDRPGFPGSYLRTFGLLSLIGLGALSTATAATLAGAGHFIGLSGVPIKVLALGISTIVDIALFLGGFRLATAKVVATRDLVLGAVLSGIAWQILLSLAGLIIGHDLRHARAIAGFFGVVLGLLAWFGLQATVTVYSIEVDVVRARRLWPRSIAQPPLTDADRRFLVDAVATERRRPEQSIQIDFSAQADHDPRRQPQLPKGR